MTDFTFRPLTAAEQKYTYAQSTQISGQTGCIGHLHGDFGSGGDMFYTSFFDAAGYLKTPEFKQDLDDVINALRSDEYRILRSRSDMVSIGRNTPESEMQGNYTTEYGFRANTKDYAFLLRCNPSKGDYNFYCFCYRRDWLDRHMGNAEKGIRFIDSGYKELFRIADGEKITLRYSDGTKMERTCRYIDDYHLEVGSNLYHICQFAELCERNGHRVLPAEKKTAKQNKEKEISR